MLSIWMHVNESPIREMKWTIVRFVSPRWEGNPGHIDFVVVGCVSAAGVEDTAPHVLSASIDCQISSVYLYNEFHLNLRHRHCYQLEFSRSAYPQNVQLGACCLSQISARTAVYEETQEDETTLDDGHVQLAQWVSSPPSSAQQSIQTSSTWIFLAAW